MAGAGYKLFNTGDVLTAAQVNTYLMEQTVMVFANAAARTTALSGVVSEGMISYLKDTNAVEVYDGSNWVSSDDPNAIQNTIVDAKGDLITATAADTPSRIAVGNNEYVLTAASAESTGLKWKQQGLTLITSASFSGSTTIAVDNVFTSTYGNYIIDIVTTSGSGSAAQIQMQLRSGGSANSTSNYNNAGSAYTYAGATENSSFASGTTAFVMRTNGGQWCGRLEIMNPQASQLTWWLSQYADTAQGGYRGGYFNATTSFDGIQFVNSGGTNVAGTIRVYGKAN